MVPAFRRMVCLFLVTAAACRGGDTNDEAAIDLPSPGVPADGGPSSAGAGSPDSGVTGDGGDAPAGCVPVKKATFRSTVAVALGCDASAPAQIIDQPLPLEASAPNSRVLGRARFRVRHVATNVIHFWNLRVLVGDGATSFGLGDDVCPGANQVRGNLGLGTASATASRAKLVGHSGAAPCTPGALVVDAGATLDVWVEDARPECAGKDIAYGSHYLANGFSDTYAWKTSMEAMPGVAAKLEANGGEKVRVLGVVEGSPTPNPNPTCGAEAATLVMQTALDGAIVATKQDVVPASQGMGHLVLSTTPGESDTDEVRSVNAGAHEAKLLVGSNFVGNVTTGGCCGDGAIALVRER